MKYRFAFGGRGNGTATTLELRSIPFFSLFEQFKTKLLYVSALFLISAGMLFQTRAPEYDKLLLNMFNFLFLVCWSCVIDNFAHKFCFIYEYCFFKC